jgi:O-antigen/teichoic acid export membrane protein
LHRHDASALSPVDRPLQRVSRLLLTAASQVLTPALSFGSSSFVSWAFGAAVYGQFAYARSASDFLVSVLSLGIPQALVIHLRREQLSIGQVLVISLGQALAAIVVGLVVWPFVGFPVSQLPFVIVVAFCFLQVMTANTRAMVLAKATGIQFGIGQAAYPFFILIGTIAITSHNTVAYFSIFCFAAAMCVIIQLTMLARLPRAPYWPIALGQVMSLGKYGMFNFIAFLAAAGALFWLNTRLVAIKGDFTQVAYFGAAYQILLIGIMPANLAAPLIFQRFAKADSILRARPLIGVAAIILGCCSALVLVLQFASSAVLLVAFGPTLVSAAPFVRVTVVAIPFAFLSTIFLALLLARDRASLYCVVHVCRAVVIVGGGVVLGIGDVSQAVFILVAAEIVTFLLSACAIGVAIRAEVAARRNDLVVNR